MIKTYAQEKRWNVDSSYCHTAIHVRTLFFFSFALISIHDQLNLYAINILSSNAPSVYLLHYQSNADGFKWFLWHFILSNSHPTKWSSLFSPSLFSAICLYVFCNFDYYHIQRKSFFLRRATDRTVPWPLPDVNNFMQFVSTWARASEKWALFYSGQLENSCESKGLLIHDILSESRGATYPKNLGGRMKEGENHRMEWKWSFRNAIIKSNNSMHIMNESECRQCVEYSHRVHYNTLYWSMRSTDEQELEKNTARDEKNIYGITEPILHFTFLKCQLDNLLWFVAGKPFPYTRIRWTMVFRSDFHEMNAIKFKNTHWNGENLFALAAFMLRFQINDCERLSCVRKLWLWISPLNRRFYKPHHLQCSDMPVCIPLKWSTRLQAVTLKPMALDNINDDNLLLALSCGSFECIEPSLHYKRKISWFSHCVVNP